MSIRQNGYCREKRKYEREGDKERKGENKRERERERRKRLIQWKLKRKQKKALTKIRFYSLTYITHFHFLVTDSPLLVNYHGHPFGKTDPSFSHSCIVSIALTHTMDFIVPVLMDSQKISSPPSFKNNAFISVRQSPKMELLSQRICMF